MSKHVATTVQPYKVTAVTLAGLWAAIFRTNPTHRNLTRWVDLEEEIQEA